MSMRSLLRLLLTMSSYFVVASVVFAVRGAACFLPLGNVGLAPLTPVRSVVRRLTLPCLCQACSNHVESATSLGQLSEGTGTWQLGQHSSYHFSPPSPLEDLLEAPNLGVISGANLEDLAEGVILGANLEDLAEGPISGTNLGDLTERVISSTNLGDLAEGPISGTNPGDLTERVISGTNLGDLAGEPI
ncbi:hypothetical protein B296_00001121 [Ensete ventricosum]|uniref:Uncharacterized protein n=1 Tax=Ensete ventricosum TaxID=4639 RepID=A0A426ZP51_ENSVE|nr:hypothetical protein B296_00001121 [Ensete ventricosum]